MLGLLLLLKGGQFSLFPVCVVNRMNMVGNIMEMGNVLRDGKAGQCLTSSSVCTVCRNGADDLNSFCPGEMKDGATTNAVDCNAVNEVSIPVFLAGADIAGEETEVVRGDGGEPKPSNLGADVDGAAHWKKCYGALWDLKIAFEKQNYR